MRRAQELSFRGRNTHKDAFFDVALEADFVAPDGRTLPRRGFYCGGDVWAAVRFRPDRAGDWRYLFRFYNRSQLLSTGERGFHTLPSSAPGSVRLNPSNRYRWVFAKRTTVFSSRPAGRVGPK